MQTSPTDPYLYAGSEAFGTFLDQLTAQINEPVRDFDEHAAHLQLLGEIVKIAEENNIDLSPTQITAIAAQIELADKLTDTASLPSGPALFFALNRSSAAEQDPQ